VAKPIYLFWHGRKVVVSLACWIFDWTIGGSAVQGMDSSSLFDVSSGPEALLLIVCLHPGV